VIETRRAPAPGSTGAVTRYKYVDGEITIRFTPEAERQIAPVVGKPPGRLRFGIPALDLLNDKYRASELVPRGDGTPGYRLRLSPDANVLRAADEYARNPLVLGAEPTYEYTIPRAPEAPEAVRTQVGPLRR
jgi:hypothetical protein